MLTETYLVHSSFQFVREDHLDRVAREPVTVSMAPHATFTTGLAQTVVALDGKGSVATLQVLQMYCSMYPWYAPHPFQPHYFKTYFRFEVIMSNWICSLYKVVL